MTLFRTGASPLSRDHNAPIQVFGALHVEQLARRGQDVMNGGVIDRNPVIPHKECGVIVLVHPDEFPPSG